MLAQKLKNINKVILIILLIFPLSSFANFIEKYPFYLNETEENEKIYSHSFEEVWNASLEYLKDLDIELREDARSEKKDIKTNIATYKNLGLITYSVSLIGVDILNFVYGGTRDFTCHNILIRPITENSTKICYYIVGHGLYNYHTIGHGPHTFHLYKNEYAYFIDKLPKRTDRGFFLTTPKEGLFRIETFLKKK